MKETDRPVGSHWRVRVSAGWRIVEIPRPSDAPYPLYGIHEPYRYDEIEEWGDRVWMPDEEAPAAPVYLTAPDKPGVWAWWVSGAPSLFAVTDEDVHGWSLTERSTFAYIGPTPPTPPTPPAPPVRADGWYWVRYARNARYAGCWTVAHYHGLTVRLDGLSWPASEYEFGPPCGGRPDE